MGEMKKREKHLDLAKPTENFPMIIAGGEVRIKTASRDEYSRTLSRRHQGRETINKKMNKKIK